MLKGAQFRRQLHTRSILMIDLDCEETPRKVFFKDCKTDFDKRLFKLVIEHQDIITVGKTIGWLKKKGGR